MGGSEGNDLKRGTMFGGTTNPADFQRDPRGIEGYQLTGEDNQTYMENS